MLQLDKCRPLVEWLCSSGSSSLNLQAKSCSFDQPCVFSSYLFLPVSILFALSLISGIACASEYIFILPKMTLLFYRCVIILCFASTFANLALFGISVWLELNRGVVVYFPILSLLFLLIVRKVHSCRLQIQSWAHLSIEICQLFLHSLLMCTQTAIAIESSSHREMAVMLTAAIVPTYVIFIMLLLCFLAQIFTIIRQKRFTSIKNSSYIADGSDLGYAEKDIGIFTYLTIGWVTPLMNRGWYGHLTSVHDTFHLPKNIDVPKCADILEEALRRELAGSVEMMDKQESLLGNQNDTIDNEHFEDFEQTVLVDRINSRSGHENAEVHHSFSVFSVFGRVYGWSLLPLLFLRVGSDVCNLATPLLLNKFISFLSHEDESIYFGLALGVGMVALTLLGVVMDQMYEYQSWKMIVKVRGAFMVTLYRKLFQVNQCSIFKFSSGEVLNYMSKDSINVAWLAFCLPLVISMPLEICCVLLLLYRQIGVSFFAGIVLCILCIPVNQFLVARILDLNEKYSKCRDKRVNMVTEILNGIRTVKLGALERFFISKVASIRSAELRNISKLKFLDAFLVYMWCAFPVLLLLAIFSTYSHLGNELTAATVFTVLSYVNLLIIPLNMFPWVFNILIEGSVSLNRLNKFYAMKAFNVETFYSAIKNVDATAGPSSSYQSSSNGVQTKYALNIENATFSYGRECKNTASGEKNLINACLECLCMEHTVEDENSEPNNKGFQQLQNISLSAETGSFVGVFGKVGSGKTSLLTAIIGELDRLSGSIASSESRNGFGYVPQEAWLQTGTIRDNILFGSKFDKFCYERILNACALVEDLKILPEGDLTQVGERGITLSGGQKTRVSLARALHKDFNLYLLDDPMSAVDAHVANHIYKHCIRGLLRHKTVILCTHHLQYLRETDLSVYLEEGKIVCSGTPEEVLPEIVKNETSEVSEKVGDMARPQEEVVLKSREDPEHKAAEQDGIVEESNEVIGNVDWRLYIKYFKAAGVFLCVSVFVCFGFMQISKNLSDWWLSYWTDNIKTSNSDSNSSFNFLSGPSFGKNASSNVESYSFYHIGWLNFNSGYRKSSRQIPFPYKIQEKDVKEDHKDAESYGFYLLVYTLIALSNSVFSLARAFFFAFASIRASLKIHEKLLDCVLKFKNSFFASTPVGVIVNRFSSDISVLDDDLPFTLNTLLNEVFSGIGILLVIIITVPYIIPFVLVMMLIFYRLQLYYRRTSRELRRIRRSTMSPVFHHFNESLTGAPVVRAMRVTELFMEENEKRVIHASRLIFNEEAVQLWFGIRVQAISAVILMLAVGFGLLQKQFTPGAVESGLLGLCLSYCLTIRSTLTDLLNTFAENEKNIISVERIDQYCNPEKFERLSGSESLQQSWPNEGAIEFRDVTLRYPKDDNESTPAALENFSLVIEGGLKMGICGRTGAGKSSVLSALFRLYEIDEGSIIIDGVEIAQVPVRVLRASLSIIPQDPFLFTGTVRENLDQSEEGNHFSKSDDELWQALERAHVKETVETLGGLDAQVGEKGQYFSAGQKQLICLARALLQDCKILCLDEATANVDTETDSKIQKTIREEFQNCTVITIAHRINTILHCDKVVVLADGKVCELGNPEELVALSGSLFSQLVAQTGAEIQ